MQKEKFEQEMYEQVVENDELMDKIAEEFNSSKKYFVLDSSPLNNGIKRLRGVDSTKEFKTVLYYDLNDKRPRLMLLYDNPTDKNLTIINDITDYVGISTNTNHKKLQTTLFDEKNEDFVDLDHQPEFYFSINPAPEDRNNQYNGTRGKFNEKIIRFEFSVIELYEDEYRCVVTKRILRRLSKDHESLIFSSKIIPLTEMSKTKEENTNLLKNLEMITEEEKPEYQKKKLRF